MSERINDNTNNVIKKVNTPENEKALAELMATNEKNEKKALDIRNASTILPAGKNEMNKELKASFDQLLLGASADKALATQNTAGNNPNVTVDPKIINTLNGTNGNTDQMKAAMGNIDKMFSGLPKGMQNFFRGLLGLLGFKIGNNEESKLGKLINTEREKDEEQRKILDSYGVKIETVNNKSSILKFLPNTKIEGSKMLPIKEGEKETSKNEPQKMPITLSKDGTISINPDKAKSVDITDKENGFIMLIKNKDGSTDTYTIKSERKKGGSGGGGG